MQMFMFEAVITNVSEWRSILAAIGNIVEDAMFICNADEVTFRGMDAAQWQSLDGCPAGLKLDERDLQPMLNWRRPGTVFNYHAEKRG